MRDESVFGELWKFFIWIWHFGEGGVIRFLGSVVARWVGVTIGNGTVSVTASAYGNSEAVSG